MCLNLLCCLLVSVLAVIFVSICLLCVFACVSLLLCFFNSIFVCVIAVREFTCLCFCLCLCVFVCGFVYFGSVCMSCNVT